MKNLMVISILLMSFQANSFDIKKAPTKVNFNKKIHETEKEKVVVEGSLNDLLKSRQHNRQVKQFIKGEIDAGQAKLVYSRQ